MSRPKRKPSAPKRKKPPTRKPDAFRPKWTPDDGITNSGLNNWMTCREQFALAYMEGYRAKGFHDAMEFGNMWHLCEDIFAKATMAPYHLSEREALYECIKATEHFCTTKRKELDAREQEALEGVRLSVIAIFQVYTDYYQNSQVEWYRREYAFRTKHPLGIEMRGKRDGEYWVDLNGVKGLGLWETKTKTKIDKNHLDDQLCCDAQSLYYLYAMHLEYEAGNLPAPPIHETYNVVKRPSIYKRKGETPEEYARRAALAAAQKPEENFLRIPFVVDASTLRMYDQMYLTPQLRSFLAWWKDLPGASADERRKSTLHYQNLSALINPYGRSSYFDALVYGRTSSLKELDDIFPELAPDPSVENFVRRMENKPIPTTNFPPEKYQREPIAV